MKLKNVSEEYLLWATQLKHLIGQLDKIIFPDAPGRVRLRMYSRSQFKATYTHPTRRGGDYYTVFVKNLGSGIRNGEDNLIFKQLKNGSIKVLPSKKFTTPAPRTILVAIACHEVRHRMQLRGKLKFLMQNPNLRRSPLLKESLRFVLYLFANIRKIAAKADAKNQFYARSMTDFRELDATTMEIMVMHAFKPGDRLRKVLPLLKLGAE